MRLGIILGRIWWRGLLRFRNELASHLNPLRVEGNSGNLKRDAQKRKSEILLGYQLIGLQTRTIGSLSPPAEAIYLLSGDHVKSITSS